MTLLEKTQVVPAPTIHGQAEVPPELEGACGSSNERSRKSAPRIRGRADAPPLVEWQLARAPGGMVRNRSCECRIQLDAAGAARHVA